MINLIGILVDWLWFLEMVALGVLSGRLFWMRLVRVYPYLTAYLLADFVASLVLWNVHSLPIMRVSEGIKGLLAVFVVWQFCRLVFERHGAVGAFAQKSAKYVVVACLAVALASWWWDPAVPEGRSPTLHHFIRMQATLEAGLFVFLSSLCLFSMVWFPVPMRRNVAVALLGFLARFGASAAAQMGINRAPDFTTWMNLISGVAALAAVVTWICLINRRGEEAISVTGHIWNPQKMRALSTQLDAINARLAQ